MSDDWRTFMCMMGGNLASIMVDVGISKKLAGAPRDVAILSLTYKHPSENGLPTNAEFDAVVAIERSIENFVAFGHDAYVGRITKQGERIFFVYTTRAEERWQTLVRGITAESGYGIELQMEHDPAHINYMKYLYPTPDDWRVIHDTDVIDALQKSGDLAQLKRKIDHWIYFPDERSARPFIAWATKDRFVHDAEYSGLDSDGEYCVRLSHVGVTEQRNVSNHTIPLQKKAEEFGGKYDGWETFVVRADDPPPD